MLIIRDKRAELNTQADSIRAKLSFSINITTNHVNFLSFDNDDMKPSKRQFHLVVIHLRQRNVQKNMMYVQSCCLCRVLVAVAVAVAVVVS